MIEISHLQARRQLRVHTDQRIPEEQWSILQAHLENCAECRAYNDQLDNAQKGLRRVLRAGWATAPGPIDGLSERVHAMRGERQRTIRWIGRVGVAVAALMVILMVGRVWKQNNELIPETGDIRSSVAQIPTPTVTQAAPFGSEPTPAATAQPGEFPDVLVYEGRKDGQANGNRQIFLLNPGSEPVNLSDNDYNEGSPAWSPDGEWIAFLSDRAGSGIAEKQKNEVFVMNLSGSRLVQLTAEPGITWQGPLSWSNDGKQIALIGTREQQGGQRWVYLVPVNAADPSTGGLQAVAGTRGAELVKFSPAAKKLAYSFSDGSRSGVTIINQEDGQNVWADWPENSQAPQPAPGSAFDWDQDGNSLVYLAAGLSPVASIDRGPPDVEAGSQIVAARNLNYSISLFFDFPNNMQVASSPWPGAFRAASWSPGGAVVFLEDLGDARANDKPGTRPGGCWTVQSRRPVADGNDDGRAVSFGGLCVEGGLDRQSWTSDRRWLVVLGRMPGEDRRSLFALRMPGRFGNDRRSSSGSQSVTPSPLQNQPMGTVLRLTDGQWAEALPHVRPRLSSYYPPIIIQPRPVTEPADPSASLPPSKLSQREGGPEGQIVNMVMNNNMKVLVSSNPDGTGGKVLAATSAELRCPRWSPDGKTLALVADRGILNEGPLDGSAASQNSADLTTSVMGKNQRRGSNSRPGEEVFLMDTETGEARQISQMALIPDLPEFTTDTPPASIPYGCPIWSPDGQNVAAVVETDHVIHLVVMPVNVPHQNQDAPLQPGVHYWKTGSPLSFVPIQGPVWSPDGRSLYLVVRREAGEEPSLVRVSLPEDPDTPLQDERLFTGPDWASVAGLSIEPDGRSAVVLRIPGKPRADTKSFLTSFQGSSPKAQLSRLDLTKQGEENWISGPMPVPLDEKMPGRLQSGEMTHLPGSIYGIALFGDLQTQNKAVFLYYNPIQNDVKPLVWLEDPLLNYAWSGDGHWLVYSTESGLWGLDVQAARKGLAAPIWLSPVPVDELDWR